MKSISVFVFFLNLLTNVLIASPGDSVDITTNDVQAYGQRLYVDSLDQFHFVYHRNQYWTWNFRYSNGNYYGRVDFAAGNIDVTRDADPARQRSTICFHFYSGPNAYFPYIDIDAGNGWGYFPNDPRTPGSYTNNWLWPNVACVNNGNIVMATGDYDGSYHHVLTTTDEGLSWVNVLNFDSTPDISRFVRSSNNHVSSRVVFVHAQFITDSMAAGQLDQDVYYSLSTDGGVTWGLHTNITHYSPVDSVRACAGLSAVFDLNDKLHIVWEGRHVVNGQYLDESKIFHWDEISNTISVVSGLNPLFPGNWWGRRLGAVPAYEPQLVLDKTNGWLFCLWHGQTDTTDYSSIGNSNGDLYGAYSNDGGLTWNSYGSANGYINLTNTHTPGALPGFCEDEDYMTANPFTFHDSLVCTYLEDKNAGSIINDTILNVIRVWVFHKSLISGPNTIGENKVVEPHQLKINISPNPVSEQVKINYILSESGEVSFKLYAADGRFIKNIENGFTKAGPNRIIISTRELTNGNYFIVFSTSKEKVRRNIIVVH
jgi:hypothetical protein